MKPENMTILCVDDTPANIRLLTHYLEKQGYNVLTAEDGFEGFKAAIQYQPDLVLLDVMMPGTDGYEVCELLKAEETTKDIPIVFLTAKNDVEDRLHGFELGAKDYITKPFNLSEISTRIKTQLELKYLQSQNIRLSRSIYRIQKAAGAGYMGVSLSAHVKSLLDMLHSRLKRIQDKADADSAVQQAVSIALELETRIKLLTETWGSYADTASSKASVFDLTPLVIEVIELVEANIDDIDIEYEAASDRFMIKSVSTVIRDALTGLIMNIAPEMKYQGTFSIGTGMTHLPEKFAQKTGGDTAEQYLHIGVTCKCKWTEKDIPDLEFDNFYVSEKHAGFAAALTITQAYVSVCGGAVDVREADKGGLIVSLYVPAEIAE